VSAATLSGTTPVSGAGGTRFVTVDGVTERAEERRYVSLNWVAPKYFATFGTPLLAGRDFAFEDEGRPPVAIVNQTMARHYFGTNSPLGRRFRFEGQDRSYEIIGVVADTKYLNLYETPGTHRLHERLPGGPWQRFAICAAHRCRTLVSRRPTSARAGNEVVPNVTVGKVTTLTEQIDASIVAERPRRVDCRSPSVWSARRWRRLGCMDCWRTPVSRRTSEIGVRMALGATREQITSMVLKRALGLVVAGLVIGAPVAVLTPRVMASLVQSLTVEAPMPLAVAAIAMIGVGLVAAFVPARRAARVEPVQALRQS
jgi:hypothetical protein